MFIELWSGSGCVYRDGRYGDVIFRNTIRDDSTDFYYLFITKKLGYIRCNRVHGGIYRCCVRSGYSNGSHRGTGWK